MLPLIPVNTLASWSSESTSVSQTFSYAGFEYLVILIFIVLPSFLLIVTIGHGVLRGSPTNPWVLEIVLFFFLTWFLTCHWHQSPQPVHQSLPPPVGRYFAVTWEAQCSQICISIQFNRSMSTCYHFFLGTRTSRPWIPSDGKRRKCWLLLDSQTTSSGPGEMVLSICYCYKLYTVFSRIAL